MEHNDHHADHHGTSGATLLWVFAALMVLLAITVAVSVIDMGPWSVFVAMGIAIIKAALVVLYFMQVRRSSFIIKAYAGAAAVWLLVGVVLSFTDYYTRSPKTTLSPDIVSANKSADAKEGAAEAPVLPSHNTAPQAH